MHCYVISCICQLTILLILNPFSPRAHAVLFVEIKNSKGFFIRTKSIECAPGIAFCTEFVFKLIDYKLES